MWHTQASNAGDHTPGAIYQEKPYIQIQLSNTYFINSVQSLVIYSDYQNSFLDTLIGCQVFFKKGNYIVYESPIITSAKWSYRIDGLDFNSLTNINSTTSSNSNSNTDIYTHPNISLQMNVSRRFY